MIGNMITIRRVNIYLSPILTALAPNNQTVYAVIDTGAQASLITLRKTNQLNLKIFKTNHTAVCVDGVTNLKILGEVHTTISRNDQILYFDALVV